jgi:hypothetical protein
MRGQLGTLVPRQPQRRVPGNRAVALQYASWDWPVTPNASLPATTDLEQVFAAWTRFPEAPILAACGVSFDVIEAEAAAGRKALLRLDRMGVELGPVIAVSRPPGPARAFGSAYRTNALRIRDAAVGHRAGRLALESSRIGFLVRPGTAAPLDALLDPGSGPRLVPAGGRHELPAALTQQRSASPERGCRWLRQPGTLPPVLPAAHVILGALTSASSRTVY